MKLSRIFLYFCLAFIGGIFLNSIIFLPQLFMLGVLILGVFLIFIFWKYKNLVVAGFCLLLFILGIWLHQQALLKVSPPPEQNITFVGTVVTEPDIRANKTKLTIKSKDINGKVLITLNRYPEYNYGDKLEITGKLLTPAEFEDFNYKDYLAKDGIYSVIYWPKIKLLDENQGNPIYAQILSFKNKLRESIYSFLSPPQSSILGAIILGDKRQIPDEWKQKLNITGVRHITAVSGMHTVILSGILMWLGINLFGFSRGKAFYLAIIFLTLFIIMVGLPASGVRAGIMAGIFLFAQKIGRTRSAARSLVFAAAIMLVQNPLLLRSDVGFQLSFLATLGIIYLMPVFRHWLGKIPNFRFLPIKNFLSPINGLLAMTFAAQIFTLPVLIYNFGYISLVSPITNILIVPLLPYIMVFGFVFGLVGMLFQSLGWILSFPSWLLLTYITKIIDFFSQIPLASVTVESPHWFWLIIIYLILCFITWRLNKRFFENYAII